MDADLPIMGQNHLHPQLARPGLLPAGTASSPAPCGPRGCGMSALLRVPGWTWNGIVEFRVFTLEVLVDAAGEPGTSQGKDSATWVCPLGWSSGHNPNLAPSCLGNRHIPEPDPDCLSDSLKEKTPELLTAARRAGSSPGLGCPCHLPPAADPSRSGLLELGVLLPPSAKPMDGYLELNQDSPPGAGAASSPPSPTLSHPMAPFRCPHPGKEPPSLDLIQRGWKEPPSLDLSCRTPPMAPAGCVAMEEALPWPPLPWRWRPAQQGPRASQGGSRPLPVLQDGLISQVSLLPRRNTRH